MIKLFQRSLFVLLVVALSASATASAASSYKALFSATLDPESGFATIELQIVQPDSRLRELEFEMPAARYELIEADGTANHEADRLRWQVPATGGRLVYRYRVTHRRSNGALDAVLDASGALFRGDDLFPPARVRALAGARSQSRVQLQVPDGWSALSQYGPAVDEAMPVVRGDRAFDRPTGWMIAGALGVRLDEIAGRIVSVAAWQGTAIRRNDILAFLRWHLPQVVAVAGRFPERLLVVSADDPFWRGGLSARRSFYLHGDRPLISENGTSTVLHELMHVALSLGSEDGADWLVEGLAEYYSLALMRRVGTISERRFEASVDGLAEWGKEAPRLSVQSSSGPVTARAVALLAAVDARWARSEADPTQRLDRVVQHLVANDATLSIEAFSAALVAVDAPKAVVSTFRRLVAEADGQGASDRVSLND